MKLLKKIKVDSWFFLAFLLFIISNPGYIWHTHILAIAVFIFFGVLYIKKEIKAPSLSLGLLFLLIYSYFILSTDASVIGMIVMAPVVLLFFLDKKALCGLIDSYSLLLALLLVPSILQFVLVNYFDISFPYYTISPYDTGGRDFDYRLYWFFVQDDRTTLFIPRFYSYFDEPGVLGTLATIILYTRKYNLREKENLIIFIGGLLTLSFFFIIMSLVYLALFTEKKKYGFIGLIVVLLAYLYLQTNPLFEGFLNRFTIEDGRIAGDHRVSEDFNYWYYHSFISSPDFWFGAGDGTAAIRDEGGSSYAHIIVDYGVVFFVIYIATLILYAIRKIGPNKYFFIWLLPFVGCMYQRPFILHIEYVFFWLAPIYYLSCTMKQKIVTKRNVN